MVYQLPRLLELRLPLELRPELPDERLAPELREEPDERLAPEEPLEGVDLDAPLLRDPEEDGRLADPLRPELDEGRLAEPLRPELEEERVADPLRPELDEDRVADPLDGELRGLVALPELRVDEPLELRVRVEDDPDELREGGVARPDDPLLRVVVPRVEVPRVVVPWVEVPRVVVPWVEVPRVVVPRVEVPLLRVVVRVVRVDSVVPVLRPVERTVVRVPSELVRVVVRDVPLATPRPVAPDTTVRVAPLRTVVRRPSLLVVRPARAPRAVVCVRTLRRALSAR